MDRSDPNWRFTVHSMVVITSNTAISMFSWKFYLLNNWNRIMKEDTHMLILGGIHGDEDGKLGPTEEWIEQETLFYIKQLEEEKADDVRDYPIKFSYECVGDFLDKDT